MLDRVNAETLLADAFEDGPVKARRLLPVGRSAANYLARSASFAVYTPGAHWSEAGYAPARTAIYQWFQIVL